MSDKWLSILIAFIGFLGAVLGSGGIVTHFIEKNEKKAERRDNKIYESLKLLIGNDFAIFKMLRGSQIDAKEVDKQEEKMQEFLKEYFL